LGERNSLKIFFFFFFYYLFYFMEKISRFQITLIQNPVTLSKETTLSKLEQLFLTAYEKTQPNLVFLGECFNTLYHRDHLIKNAESFDDPEAPTLNLLKKLAAEKNVYIFACIPESKLDFTLFLFFSFLRNC
jgi:predicted amidohydrolase